MLLCESCKHPMVFHELNPPEDPCIQCQRGACKLSGCKCTAYDGVKLNREAHLSHTAVKTRFGAWGLVQFTTVKEQSIIA